MHRTRRNFLSSTLFGACTSALALPRLGGEPLPGASLCSQLQKIELESGGRLGVAMTEEGSGSMKGYRTQERFPMCSTFKALAVAAILHRVDQNQEQLQRRIGIHQNDLLEYAPVTKQHVGANGMTIQDLCEAAITLSDNTAVNLLLNALGGPSAITAYARAIGDSTTRLDRTEPTLNEAIPGDVRDTTTPAAMAHNLQKLLLGDALSPSARALLKDWMLQCKTGDKKIRAGLPPDCQVADKTGSGQRNTSNDIAVIWPIHRSPLVLVTYLTGSRLTPDDQSAALARAAHACWAARE